MIEVEAPKFTNWMGSFSHVNAAMQHASSGGIPVGMSSSNNASVTNVILEHVWVEAAIDDKRSQNVASGWLTVAAGTQEPQCMRKIHEDSENRRTPYKAMVHEAPITVLGWRGSGYILIDPETGAGGYMIDGGKNVVYLIVAGLVIIAFAKFLLLINPVLSLVSG